MGKINSDLRSVDGQTIFLPQEVGGDTGAGNLALPNIYEEDSVQKYPIGTRLEMGERVFRYYKAGAAITYLLAGICSYDCRTGNTVDSYDTSQAAGVGTVANPLKIDGTSDGVPAINAYAGHYVVIYVSSTLGVRQMKVLSSSAAESASPYTVELVLDQPTPMAIAANTGCDLFPSRYADCRSAFQGQDGELSANWNPVVGIPMAIMTSGRWGWCQTWGSCFVVNTSTQLGDASYDRTAIFNSDGSVAPSNEGWHTADTANQMAGYTLATADGSGSEWIMLMLDR